MNKPNAPEIRARLEQRRERDREEMRRDQEARDAFVVQTVRSLTEGQPVVAQDPEPWRVPSAVETTAATAAGARRAIEARGGRPASSRPSPHPGEPPLRASLRGIVEDYAEPMTPSERLVTDLEALSGIALGEADSYGLWADLEVAEVLAIRAAMPDVIEIVTERAESVIISELVAAQARLAREYPDAPLPDALDPNDPQS